MLHSLALEIVKFKLVTYFVTRKFNPWGKLNTSQHARNVNKVINNHENTQQMN